jgi:predicted RNase H-like HicB family nuclease
VRYLPQAEGVFSAEESAVAEREFTVIVEQDEDGFFVGSVPELRGCHTQGRTIEELLELIKDAILLCLDDEDEQEPPMKLVAIHRVAV